MAGVNWFLSLCVLLLVLFITGQPIPNQFSESSGVLGTSENLLWKNFSIDCDPQVGNLQTECNSWTLNKIAENATDATHVDIKINIAHFQLAGRVNFEHHKSLSITGETAIISCTGVDSGLQIVDISKVTVSGIIITNCGTPYKNSTFIMYYYTMSLIRCRDITITTVSFTKNKATALSILDHQGGTINISHCNFTENSVTEADGILGGGGVHIGSFEFQNIPTSPSFYFFSDCVFDKNIARTVFYNFIVTDDQGQSSGGYGRGGGVYLNFKAAVTDIYAEFLDCTFRENLGFLGGGLSVQIRGGIDQETSNISVTVKDSLFEANGCSLEKPSGNGGGIHLSFNTYNWPNLSKSQYYFVNVNFSNNCAELGGGVYFFSGHRRTSNDVNTLLFENCIFTSNHAHTGSAIDFSIDIFDRLADGFLVIPTLKDCQFLSNTVDIQPLRNRTTFGIGAVYSSQYNIRFEGETVFFNNTGTALYVVNGYADFTEGDVIFIQNSGIRGGAVALIGLSSLLVGAEGNYSFINSIAVDSGGAIFSLMIDNHDYSVSRSCFIQHVDQNNPTRVLPVSQWGANISFTGNRAKAGTGHAIFATSLHPCQAINNGTITRPFYVVIDTQHVFSIRKITFDDKLWPQVATEGAILRHFEHLLEVIPGEQYNHGVTLSDDLGNPADGTFQASINDNPEIELDSAFFSCLSDQITLKGEPNESAELFLQTVSQRQVYTKLKVQLIDCPPGFTLQKDECVCNAHQYVGLIRCDIHSLNSYLYPGFWIGLVSDSSSPRRIELATGICSPGFCDYNGSEVSTLGVRLPQRASLLDGVICGESRTGILCGECREGYTTDFHSPNFLCKQADPTLCKVGWLFYILSELVPVTVVFITVLVLNISFTSGAVNGFILFSQLINSLNVNSYGLISQPNSTIVGFIRAYRVIYGFFNLDYFSIENLSFCLWTNASALDMIAFKYVTIIYALLLVITVVWFMNKYAGRCLGKWYRITKLKSSVIHGITTFLVICYAQCINVSLTLLLRYRYTPEAGSELNIPTIVWLNGNLVYLSGRHLLYALPALFCLVTIGILPPILLLSYPLFNKVMSFFGLEGVKPMKFISRNLRMSSLKPLFDSFQGCFKDNLRFFAGLYFIYRWIGLVVNASTPRYSVFFMVVEILLLCVLALHAICQPYTVKVHNIVDTLLFTNLAVINAISFANYYRNQTFDGRAYETQFVNTFVAIQLILIYLPLVSMVVYALVAVCKCWRLHNSEQGQCLPGRSWERSLTESISFERVYKLKSLLHTTVHTNGSSNQSGSLCDREELPHRLTADFDELDYHWLEDDDLSTSLATETYL